MPLDRWALFAVLVLATSSCGPVRRTTTSLPPAPGDGPRLAEEIHLSAGDDTVTGKITALRGDTVTILPAPYWGQETRAYPLDALTAVEVRRPGRGGDGFVYTFAVTFTLFGLMAGSSAQYDEDYSSALAGAGVLGLLAGGLGAAVTSGTRTTTYDLRDMSVERRRELVRRLMAHDGGAEPGLEEVSW